MRATWILPDGRRITADVAEGTTLMAAAVAADVPLVIGECGGNLACATCHVVVDTGWRSAAGEPALFEESMLDITEAIRQPGSRLSCQIVMRPALDGIVLQVPQP